MVYRAYSWTGLKPKECIEDSTGLWVEIPDDNPIETIEKLMKDYDLMFVKDKENMSWIYFDTKGKRFRTR